MKEADDKKHGIGVNRGDDEEGRVWLPTPKTSNAGLVDRLHTKLI